METKTQEKTKTKYKSFPSSLLSLLSCARADPGPLFIALSEKDLELWPLAQNLGSNRLLTAADTREKSGFGGKIWAVEARFSVVSQLRGCYPRGLLEDRVGARISPDSRFKSWALLGFELISLIIAN